MSKKRRTITIDADIEEWLQDSPGFNVSGAINRYLRARKEGADHGEVVTDFRRAELEAEIESARAERERQAARVDRLTEELNALDRDEEEDVDWIPVDEFIDKIESGEFPLGHLEASNAAVQTHAEKAGVDPDRFVELVQQRVNQFT